MKRLHNEHVGALSQLSAAFGIPLRELTAIYTAELDRLCDSEYGDGVLGVLALRNTCLKLRERIRG